MSGVEIERKFLVRKGDAYKRVAFSCTHIQQGYIPAEGATVRVRVRDDHAYLTIKSRSQDGGLSRYEFEKEITLEEGHQLMLLCEPGLVDKTRWLVRHGGHVFEVDEFYGDNTGLVMAEVELSSVDESAELPDFIGVEVTGDRRYYNSQLRQHPYCKWGDKS